MGTQPHRLLGQLSVTTFLLAVTETTAASESEILTIWSFTEKLAPPLTWTLQATDSYRPLALHTSRVGAGSIWSSPANGSSSVGLGAARAGLHPLPLNLDRGPALWGGSAWRGETS